VNPELFKVLRFREKKFHKNRSWKIFDPKKLSRLINCLQNFLAKKFCDLDLPNFFFTEVYRNREFGVHVVAYRIKNGCEKNKMFKNTNKNKCLLFALN
jgi:hypothetical protein